MRVYLDVNCFFDFVLGREKFYNEVWQIITLAIHNDIICGTNPNNFPFAFHHLKKDESKKKLNHKDFKHRLALLRKSIECSVLDGEVIDAALSMSKPADLEDAVILQSALQFKADILISRDKALLKNSIVKTMTPGQFLKSWVTK